MFLGRYILVNVFINIKVFVNFIKYLLLKIFFSILLSIRLTKINKSSSLLIIFICISQIDSYLGYFVFLSPILTESLFVFVPLFSYIRPNRWGKSATLSKSTTISWLMIINWLVTHQLCILVVDPSKYNFFILCYCREILWRWGKIIIPLERIFVYLEASTHKLRAILHLHISFNLEWRIRYHASLWVHHLLTVNFFIRGLTAPIQFFPCIFLFGYLQLVSSSLASSLPQHLLILIVFREAALCDNWCLQVNLRRLRSFDLRRATHECVR